MIGRLKNPWVREGTQWAVIVVLITSAWYGSGEFNQLTEDLTDTQVEVTTAKVAATTNSRGLQQVETLLANTCQITPDPKLVEEGLLHKCALAEANRIEQVVPNVNPQTINTSATGDAIDAAVARYLDSHPVTVTGLTTDELRAEVASLLAADPNLLGPQGKPGEDASPVTDGQVAQALAVILTENPPKALMSASVDAGCHLILAYTDGTSDTVGPICGPKGEQGPLGGQGPPGQDGQNGQDATPEMVANAVDNYCAGGACVGPAGYPVSIVIRDPVTGGETTYSDPDGDHVYTAN